MGILEAFKNVFSAINKEVEEIDSETSDRSVVLKGDNTASIEHENYEVEIDIVHYDDEGKNPFKVKNEYSTKQGKIENEPEKPDQDHDRDDR